MHIVVVEIGAGRSGGSLICVETGLVTIQRPIRSDGGVRIFTHKDGQYVNY